MSDKIPLSRPFAVASVPSEGLEIEVVANADELAALAAENDVESIESFVARFDLRPVGRDGLKVGGSVKAQTTRLCGVTLEPFVEPVVEEIDMRFEPEEKLVGREDDENAPDPIVNGVVDLGAVAAEFFTLGLKPFPRKPGASFDQSEAVGDGEASPFAALSRLKTGGSDGGEG